MDDQRADLLAKVRAHRLSRRTAVRGVGSGLTATLLAMAGWEMDTAAQAGTSGAATPAPGTGNYAVIRRYVLAEGASMDELVRRVETGFVPIVSGVPGFVSYTLIVPATGPVHASISVFRDKAGADESTRRAASWVQANVSSLVQGPPEVTAGLVRIRATASGTMGTPAA